MRKFELAAVFAALLATTACEKASDKAVNQASNGQFDVQNCAPETLDATAHIASGACIVSANKAYVFIMRSAGSLDLAQLTPTGQIGSVLWTSGSKGSAPDKATAELQGDGNLVIYESSKPIWDSHSSGKIGNYSLAVTDQGNAVLRNADGRTIWAALFTASLCPQTLNSPDQVGAGGCLVSPGKTYAMILQKTGALQVVQVTPEGGAGKPIWSSGNHLAAKTNGVPFLAVQKDGNLVVYLKDKPIWNTETNGKDGAHSLDLGDDGELKLHGPDGAVVWSSKTGKAKA